MLTSNQTKRLKQYCILAMKQLHSFDRPSSKEIAIYRLACMVWVLPHAGMARHAWCTAYLHT